MIADSARGAAFLQIQSNVLAEGGLNGASKVR